MPCKAAAETERRVASVRGAGSAERRSHHRTDRERHERRAEYPTESSGYCHSGLIPMRYVHHEQ